MFDLIPTHMIILGLVAMLLIGPKDMPRVMRVVGQWVGRGRAMTRHFRSAIDEMIREAELQEMEKKWQAENERIMREHAGLIHVDPTVAPSQEALPPPAQQPAEADPPAAAQAQTQHQS